MSNEPEQPVSTSDPAPVTDAGRLRRPASLRSAAASAPVPRRKLTPPPFPRRDSKLEAQPESTDPATPATDAVAPATDAVAPTPDAGPSPTQKLVTLVRERPEVGLGIAFAAGLVIATILKRLAR